MRNKTKRRKKFSIKILQHCAPILEQNIIDIAPYSFSKGFIKIAFWYGIGFLLFTARWMRWTYAMWIELLEWFYYEREDSCWGHNSLNSLESSLKEENKTKFNVYYVFKYYFHFNLKSHETRKFQFALTKQSTLIKFPLRLVCPEKFFALSSTTQALKKKIDKINARHCHMVREYQQSVRILKAIRLKFRSAFGQMCLTR